MSVVANQLDPQRLLALLSQQRDLYVRLRELSDQQRALIVGDRADMLLSILSQRQDLVTSLSRLNEQLAPFRRDWDAMYAALPEDCRLQAANLLAEINGLLRNILRTDQQDTALLSARKQATGAEIGGLNGGRAANTAYARQSPPRGVESAQDWGGAACREDVTG